MRYHNSPRPAQEVWKCDSHLRSLLGIEQSPDSAYVAPVWPLSSNLLASPTQSCPRGRSTPLYLAFQWRNHPAPTAPLALRHLLSTSAPYSAVRTSLLQPTHHRVRPGVHLPSAEHCLLVGLGTACRSRWHSIYGYYS